MKTKNILILATAFALAAVGVPPLKAAEGDAKKEKPAKQDSSSKLGAADQKFVKTAGADGLAEVKLGELARDKAARQEVKDFGAMMASDHSKANEELMTLATEKGVTLPTELDAKNKATADRLSKLEGEAFDKAYVAEMIAAHKKSVSAFEAASKSLKDAELKAFAEKTLPTLKTHLEAVQALQGATGAKKGS